MRRVPTPCTRAVTAYWSAATLAERYDRLARDLLKLRKDNGITDEIDDGHSPAGHVVAARRR